MHAQSKKNVKRHHGGVRESQKDENANCTDQYMLLQLFKIYYCTSELCSSIILKQYLKTNSSWFKKSRSKSLMLLRTQFFPKGSQSCVTDTKANWTPPPDGQEVTIMLLTIIIMIPLNGYVAQCLISTPYISFFCMILHLKITLENIATFYDNTLTSFTDAICKFGIIILPQRCYYLNILPQEKCFRNSDNL